MSARFGKKRVPGCECEDRFTCRLCLNEVLPPPARLEAALAELAAAQAEELEASNAYAGDDLTEDWHRAALARLMRAEDAVERARKAVSS